MFARHTYKIFWQLYKTYIQDSQWSDKQYVFEKHTCKIYKIEVRKTYMQDILLIQQYIPTRQSISNSQYTSEKRTYKTYKHDIRNTYIKDIQWLYLQYIPAKHTYKMYIVDVCKTYIQDNLTFVQDIHTRQSMVKFTIRIRKTYIQDIQNTW